MSKILKYIMLYNSGVRVWIRCKRHKAGTSGGFFNTKNFGFNERRRNFYQLSDCYLLKKYSVPWILTNPQPSTSPTTVLSTTVERSEKYQRRGTQNLNSAFACAVILHYP